MVIIAERLQVINYLILVNITQILDAVNMVY